MFNRLHISLRLSSKKNENFIDKVFCDFLDRVRSISIIGYAEDMFAWLFKPRSGSLEKDVTMCFPDGSDFVLSIPGPD